MAVAKPEVSARARAIIEGLMRTRRGSAPRFADAYVQLRAKVGGFYFVALNGARLLRGDAFEDAEELQAKFAEAMAKAGERPSGQRP
jgi:hypothetical protein